MNGHVVTHNYNNNIDKLVISLLVKSYIFIWLPKEYFENKYRNEHIDILSKKYL